MTKKNEHFSKFFLPHLFVQLMSDMKIGVVFFCRENVLVKKMIRGEQLSEPLLYTIAPLRNLNSP